MTEKLSSVQLRTFYSKQVICPLFYTQSANLNLVLLIESLIISESNKVNLAN